MPIVLLLNCDLKISWFALVYLLWFCAFIGSLDVVEFVLWYDWFVCLFVCVVGCSCLVFVMMFDVQLIVRLLWFDWWTGLLFDGIIWFDCVCTLTLICWCTVNFFGYLLRLSLLFLFGFVRVCLCDLINAISGCLTTNMLMFGVWLCDLLTGFEMSVMLCRLPITSGYLILVFVTLITFCCLVVLFVVP